MQQILPLPRICCCCSTLCGHQSVYPGSRSIREAIICCYCTFSGAIILLGYTAFDSFISNWQSELFSLYKMSTIQMMFGADLFSCLFTGWPSTIEGGNFLSAVGFMMTLSLPSMPQYCHWLQRQSNFLFFTPYSLLGQLCLPSSWPLEWCWVSCCRALFIITHCLLKLFCCVCCTALRVYARYRANYHLQRGNCLDQGNVIRKECWLTLLITADYCQVMVLNFFSTAQFQSFSKILYCRRLLSKMSLNPQ